MLDINSLPTTRLWVWTHTPPWPRVRADALPHPCGRGHASTRARGRATRVHAVAVFTASASKHECARTSGRKRRPDGHFHPKTSFMTSPTAAEMLVHDNVKYHKLQWTKDLGCRNEFPPSTRRPDRFTSGRYLQYCKPCKVFQSQVQNKLKQFEKLYNIKWTSKITWGRNLDKFDILRILLVIDIGE
jgi:hypothetical protein